MKKKTLIEHVTEMIDAMREDAKAWRAGDGPQSHSAAFALDCWADSLERLLQEEKTE